MIRKTSIAAASLLLALGMAFPASAEDAGTHTTHTKAMKERGVKDGDGMKDVDDAAAVPAPASSAQSDDGTPTHTLHSKTMKEQRGVKDGDKMRDASGVAVATEPAPPAQSDDGTPTHTLHSKAMKERGAKDGDKMKDSP